MEVDNRMSIDEIREMFMSNMGCAQAVAGQFTEETGLDREQLYRMGAAFDGGMMRGETCGCIVAANMIIGCVAGHSGPNQDEQKGQMLTLMLRFNELFREKRDSFMCRELLDADISTPEGMSKIVEGGLMMNVCPVIVQDTVECLKQAISEVIE